MAKKKEEKRKFPKVNWFKWATLALILIIFIVIVSRSFDHQDVQEEVKNESYWEVNDGKLNFTYIEDAVYNSTLVEDYGDYKIYNLTFISRGKTIYARAYIPSPNVANGNGIVTLHAARAKKEHHDKLDKKLLDLGYYVITIDQRGHGQTGGESPTLQQDYERYLKHEEPIIYLYVYDAMLAANVLRKMGAEKIVYLGESMGGRFAITAAALDKESSGVFVFSTGGIEINEDRTAFIDSIDPNTYIGDISPRAVVIYHAAADDVIPIWFAEKSFTLAKEPKKFEPMRGTCQHGYCDIMDEYMFRDLDWIFSQG